MRKLKKRKIALGVHTDAEIRRNRLIFAGASVAALLVIVGLIAGYVYLTNWFLARDLARLQSTSPDTRILGVRNLARGRHTEHISKICDIARSDASPKIRKESVDALVRMNHRSAVPTLVYALGDEDDSVAYEAMKALQAIADKDLDWPAALDWWAAHKGEYEAAYHRTGDDGVPVVADMMKLLNSKDRLARLGAVQRLARLKHAEAAKALAAAATDADPHVRAQATEALAVFGGGIEQKK